MYNSINTELAMWILSPRESNMELRYFFTLWYSVSQLLTINHENRTGRNAVSD